MPGAVEDFLHSHLADHIGVGADPGAARCDIAQQCVEHSPGLMTRCEASFAADGCIVDHPFQPRLPDGMIRCYMGTDKVVGFGHQLIKALIPPPPEGLDSATAQLGPRTMHGPEAPPFKALREKMEAEWTSQMMDVLGIDAAAVPIIWDADFLYGPRTASGEDTYVLCEINVSSVFAIPGQAPEAIARLALSRLRAGRAEPPN
jgi:hypothetical protein